MPRAVFPLAALAFAAVSGLAAAPARAQDLPDGWKLERRAGEATLTPPGLKRGEVFVVTILPEEEPGRRSLADWFAEQVARDMPLQGTVVKDGPTEPAAGGALRRALLIEDARGRRLLLVYVAAPSPRGKHQLLRALSTPRPEVYARNMEIAGKIIAGQPVDRPADRPAPEETRRERSKPPEPDPKAAYRTAPGRGIQPSEIELVMANMGVNAALLGSGITAPEFKPVLLLKSGEYCMRVDLPPGDIDAAAHKRAHPGAWGKWRRVGSKYERTNAKGNWVKAGWERRLSPARPGEELRGTYASTSGGGNSAYGGNVTVASVNRLTFLPGGKFRLERTGATIFDGSRGPVGGGVSSSSEADGTYELEGSSLELRHRDGTVERRAFHWGDPKGKTSIFLNQVLYALDDEKAGKKRRRR